MAETPETAPDLLPDVFNAFPESLRAFGDGQPLLDALAENLPIYDAIREREVRAKVAEELREYAEGFDRSETPVVWEVLRLAARMVEGGKP